MPDKAYDLPSQPTESWEIINPFLSHEVLGILLCINK